MNRFWKLVGLTLLLVCAFGLSTQALAVEKIFPDHRAVDLVKTFMNALSIQNSNQRNQAVLALVHKSLMNQNGNGFDRNIRDFSYKKAWQNVRFYAIPAEIVEVHKGKSITIGFGETAEKGRTDKYFVNKKKGQNGLPAPIHVFWPDSGGAPKILNMGSL